RGRGTGGEARGGWASAHNPTTGKTLARSDQWITRAPLLLLLHRARIEILARLGGQNQTAEVFFAADLWASDRVVRGLAPHPEPAARGHLGPVRFVFDVPLRAVHTDALHHYQHLRVFGAEWRLCPCRHLHRCRLAHPALNPAHPKGWL